MWDQFQLALNQSMARVITRAANLLPGVMALIVALFVFGAVAWGLAVLVRRSLLGIDFDRRVVRWGFPNLAEFAPSRSPTLLVMRLVAWFVIAVGFLVGISAFDATLISEFVERLFAYLPNVLAALLLVIGGNLIARFLARSVLIGAVNMNLHYARLLSSGIKWLVVVLTVAMALDHLAIGGSIVHLAFAILFGGIVFALSLAVGLGSKDLISRSLEREATRVPEEIEEPFTHL